MDEFGPFKFKSRAGRRAAPMPSIFLSIPHFLLIFAISIPPSLGGTLPAPPIFEAISHYPPFCYLPPESGICPENRTSSAQMTIGKPEGRQSGEESTNRLGPPPPTAEDYAEGGMASGPGPLLTRFYFDSITAQCYPFGAQECGGNENRFETQAECLTKCKTY